MVTNVIDFTSDDIEFISKKLGIRVYLISVLHNSFILDSNKQIIEKRTGVFTLNKDNITREDYQNFHSFDNFHIKYKNVIINHMIDSEFIEMMKQTIREEKLNKILPNK